MYYINHMKLTCDTTDNKQGFLCGAILEKDLFNVMIMTPSGWQSRLYPRDQITLTEDAYKNVDAAQLEKLGLQRSNPVTERLIQAGDKVVWHYETTHGWGFSIRVPATVVKVTAKRVIIDAEMKDGSTARRTVRPDKLKYREMVQS